MRFLISILCFLTLQVSYATPLKNIVIFGDSLSDTGNLYEYMQHQLPQSPPYFTGHFSNGPIWVEYLSKALFTNPTKHTFDYAYGGAGILIDEEDDDVYFTLKKEIDTYLLVNADKAAPDSMFIIWIGGNNYLGLPDDLEEITNNVIQGTQKGVERLIKAGARNITLINLPQLDKTPLSKMLEGDEAFRVVSELHNNKISQLATQLKESHPEAHIIHFDINQLYTDLLSRPSDFGFEHVTENCYDAMINPQAKPTLLKMVASVRPKQGQALDCNKYFFFDLVHPTTQVHKLISQYMLELFNQENISFIETD